MLDGIKDNILSGKILEAFDNLVKKYKWEKIFSESSHFILDDPDILTNIKDDLKIMFSKENIRILAENMKGISGYQFSHFLHDKLVDLMLKYGISDENAKTFVCHYEKIIICELEKNDPDRYLGIFLSDWKDGLTADIQGSIKKIEEIRETVCESRAILDNLYSLLNDIRKMKECDSAVVPQEKVGIETLKSVLNAAVCRACDKAPGWERLNNGPLLPIKAKGIKEKEPIDLNELVKQSWRNGQKHIVLTGIGGSGKTVFLLMLAQNMSIPTIYIPLSNLSGNKKPIRNYIEKTVIQGTENAKACFQLIESISKQTWQDSPQLLLLLDGFNEISENVRENIRAEIREWSDRIGIQMILTSRYDFTFEIDMDNAMLYEMQPLDKYAVKKYLKDNHICIPDENDNIWKVLDTPILLDLYVRVERSTELKEEPYILWRANKNGGSVIWNYLQSEIAKFRKGSRPSGKVGAVVGFVAPYIAYRMASEKQYILTYREYTEYRKTACELYNECAANNRLPDCISELAGGDNVHLEEQDAINILTKKMDLFCHVTRGYRMMHQHFRDCLAAIHVFNMVDMALAGKKDMLNEVYGGWKWWTDTYVFGFVVDLMKTENCKFSKSMWNNLWEKFRKKSLSTAEFVGMMLELYRCSYGSDISQINFSGLDLSNVSLSGLQLTDVSRRHFRGSKVGYGTFKGTGHTMTVSGISWRKGGMEFLSASHDCNMILWNQSEKAHTVIDRQHRHYIRCTQFSPENEHVLVSAGDDKELVRWTEIEGVWHSEVLGMGEDWIFCVAWDSQGKRVAYGDRKGNVKLNIVDGEDIVLKQNHTDFVRSIVWSPYEDVFASGSDDGSVCIWNADSLACVKKIKVGQSPIRALAWVNHGSYFLVADINKIYFLDMDQLRISAEQEIFLKDSEMVLEYVMPDANITCASARMKQNKDDYIAVCTEKDMTLYKIEYGKKKVNLIVLSRNELSGRSVTAIDWNYECQDLAYGCSDGTVYTIHLTEQEFEGERIEEIRCAQGYALSARCSCWSHDGKRLAVGYDDCRIRIWDIRTERCIGVLKGHKRSVKCVAWAPNDSMLVSGSDDWSIKIWNVNKKSCVKTKAFHKGSVNGILWLKDGKIISCSDDRTIYEWDWDSDKITGPLKKHDRRVYSLAVDPEEKLLVSVGNDRRLCLWEIETGENLQEIITNHSEPIRSVTWSNDGTTIATGANDKQIFVWKFDTDNKQINFNYFFSPGHTDFVYSLMYTSDDRYLVSGSSDKTISVWNVKEGRIVKHGSEHSDFVWNVSTSPEVEGKYYVASSSSDGSVKIWNITELSVNEQEPEIHSTATLSAFAGTDIVGCDFTDAIFESDKVKVEVCQNGGKV